MAPNPDLLRFEAALGRLQDKPRFRSKKHQPIVQRRAYSSATETPCNSREQAVDDAAKALAALWKRDR